MQFICRIPRLNCFCTRTQRIKFRTQLISITDNSFGKNDSLRMGLLYIVIGYPNFMPDKMKFNTGNNVTQNSKDEDRKIF